jgi:anaerobic magnesium-protoporphyrin IX monomethyl ester cyclase
MKVLLVQPPIEDFYDTAIRTYPLSLLYLATKIRDICDLSIIDFRSNKKPKVIHNHPFPELKNYYREDIHTPFSFFSRFYHFGCNHEEIKKAIREQKPDVVGISSLFTTYAMEAIEVARCVKGVSKDITTIMGGIHPTLFPHHLLKSPYVDYVIRGEGETPFFQLITSLKSGITRDAYKIKGVCSKKGDGFNISDINIENNIDLIPDRRLLNPENYRINRKNYTFFLTSRGCPFHCAFCGKPQVPYRKRSLTSIEKEVLDCVNGNIQTVDFEDDMLNLDVQFFNQVLKLFEGKGITLSAMNGIYTESLDVKTLERMFNSGFRRLNFSLVDISESVIQRQKRLFPANLLKLLPYLESSPFLVETHFIIGLPEQKLEDILETIIFLMGKRLLLGPSMFYLAPNSPIFKNTVGGNWEKHIKAMRSSCMMSVNPLLPRDTIYTFIKLVRFINLVKHILDKEANLKKLSDLLGLPFTEKNAYDKRIFTTLLLKKRFIYYDIKRKDFYDEPQDNNLVKLFFKRAKGSLIRGFKTMNSLKVN